jgi:hypothetical protein
MMEFSSDNLDKMTPAEFEEYLPELFASGRGRISEDPRFTGFFAAHPDCSALVRDLETIAEHARSLFEPVHDPSDSVWTKIKSKLHDQPEEPGQDS